MHLEVLQNNLAVTRLRSLFCFGLPERMNAHLNFDRSLLHYFYVHLLRDSMIFSGIFVVSNCLFYVQVLSGLC